MTRIPLPMKRDFLFLAVGIPKNRLIRDKHYFMALPAPEVLKLFEALGKRLPEVHAHLLKNRCSPLLCIGVRNDFQEEKEAADHAWATLDGIVDVYCLCVDAVVPEICSYFLCRAAGSLDAKVLGHAKGGWASVQPKAGVSDTKWEQVKTSFSQRLMRLFDVAVRVDPQANTPLAHQLLYSARMFRHGCEYSVFGIQYLCKFSALEGLVCGSKTAGKHTLLKTRLGVLFRESASPVAADIRELWELRCTASHQAKAFPFEDVPDSINHSAHIAKLERLFQGATLFALDHLDNSQTVEQLWDKAALYNLPACALAERPSDIPRFAIERALLDPKILCHGAGSGFDKFYAS
jgi:hypothetical protein